MNEERKDIEGHLSDAELFAIAAPATGEPEALPEHLSRCRDCARALREWKEAVRSSGDEETGALARRSDAEWRAAEDATLERIRRAGRSPGRAHPWRWALAAAASLLVAALVLSGRRPAPTAVAVAKTTPAPAAVVGAASELSPADAADDALLKESAYLASGADVDSDALEGRL